MRWVVWVLLCAPAWAGDRVVVEAGEALDQESCRAIAARVMRDIEGYTRMRFRRPVPVYVQPKAVWEAAIKAQGIAGEAARMGAGFYDFVDNEITIVPWIIGGYLGGNPAKKSREEWLWILESTIIHELFHAIHFQNFYVNIGGGSAASLRAAGQTEEEIDEATVEVLTSEGMAELVPVRVASDDARPYLDRRPERELDAPDRYWQRYQPDGKRPFRLVLWDTGYQDGLNLLHHLSLKTGPRGLRAVLYRPPPRELLFQPEMLAKTGLDDPPDPDAIFGFLSPELPQGTSVFLAVNPGRGRYFAEAFHRVGGPRTCLVGYGVEVGKEEDPSGRSRYAFYVADPDAPGSWSQEQADSLAALHPAGTSRKKVALPLAKKAEADLLAVKAPDGSLWVRAEAQGLVVLAHETKPTKNLSERAVLALRALGIRRPTPKLYDAAAAEARKVVK